MKTIEFWDKETPVNGVEASKILQNAFFKNARRLFLIKDDVTGIASNIESVDIIRSNMELGAECTDEEVAAAYLEKITNPPAVAARTYAAIPAMEEPGTDNDRLAGIESKLDKILSLLEAWQG